jgi:hypothetical protein
MKTKLNLAEIRNALFQEQPRTKLTRDYFGDSEVQYNDANSFTDALLLRFNQESCKNPLSQQYSNDDVLVSGIQTGSRTTPSFIDEDRRPALRSRCCIRRPD